MSDELLSLARKAVAKWQPRVHLVDYRISVVVGLPDYDDGNALGHVKMGHTIKSALIYIPPDFSKRVAEEAYCHATDLGEQVEEVVLHELLHVCEQPYHGRVEGNIEHLVGTEGMLGEEIRTAYTYYRENWINAMCRVLLEADRGAWAHD